MAELIIMFREVLEASLIIGILYTYLKKSSNNSSIKMLWGGGFRPIFVSIIASIIFYINGNQPNPKVERAAILTAFHPFFLIIFFSSDSIIFSNSFFEYSYAFFFIERI